jgi:hypothetical protein
VRTDLRLRMDLRSGSPACEDVPALALGQSVYRLLHSPLRAQGLAHGDLLRLTDPTSGLYEVVRPSGNFCIQMAGSVPPLDCAATRQAIHTLLLAVGGWVDTHTDDGTRWSLTVPSRAGVLRIEGVMHLVQRLLPGFTWAFANSEATPSGPPSVR